MVGQVALWSPSSNVTVSDSISDPAIISSRALQLRPRERDQIAMNFEAKNFEVATTYVWTRTMALLKRQLATLGIEFIGEILQRSDIDEYSDALIAVSDSEAISLARDLGMISAAQTMRFLHAQEVVAFFASLDNDPTSDSGEMMTQEDAVSCLRVCVQGVLGQENVGVAEDFKAFRARLGSSTIDANGDEINKLKSSPYFFKRTGISVVLSLLRTSKGAQFEHAARNAKLLIPALWIDLNDPERWQVGQNYAEEFNDGRKDVVKHLYDILTMVSGFDYVPENLRSTTFVKVANAIMIAHEGMNNFYNEPAPMRELASLGSSIPGPAFAACMTATLCVKLGNFYGVSNAAQYAANEVLSRVSPDRWRFYLDERLLNDRKVLYKLSDSKPRENWIALVAPIRLDPNILSNKEVRALLSATNGRDSGKISAIANRLLHTSLN